MPNTYKKEIHYLGRDSTGILTKKSQNLTMKYDTIKDKKSELY